MQVTYCRTKVIYIYIDDYRLSSTKAIATTDKATLTKKWIQFKLHSNVVGAIADIQTYSMRKKKSGVSASVYMSQYGEKLLDTDLDEIVSSSCWL